MNFLTKLTEEILYEAEEDLGVPPKVQKLLTHFVYSEPFAYKFFSEAFTDWISDSSVPTAGVAVRRGRIKFYYNPAFINGLSEGQLNFLLQHELYHILRGHQNRASRLGATNQQDHQIFNIAADSLINEDCFDDGGFGNRSIKFIDGGWTLKKKDLPGASEVNTLEDQMKEEYTGNRTVEAVYKWSKKKIDDYKQQQDEKGENGEGESEDDTGDAEQQKRDMIKPGSVVRNKNGSFGRVKSVDGDNIEVEEISEEEAKQSIQQSFVKKKKEIKSKMKGQKVRPSAKKAKTLMR